MRFSLPGGEAEVTPGATLAECRPALAVLLGPLAGAPLAADGVVLAEDQVAGVPPWSPGCHLEPVPDASPDRVRRATPAGPDDPATAATADWHVAVVAGPDAGAVRAPGRAGALTVGRAPGDGLALSDPAASRRHALVAARGRRIRARDAGSANGTWVLRRGRWRRVGRRRGVRVRPGTRLRVGGTVLEVRTAVPATHDAEPTQPTDAARDRTGASPDAGRPDPAVRAATVVAPLVSGMALAAALRSPVLLAVALAGPAAVAAPEAVRRVRADRARRALATGGPDLGPDAAACGVLLADRSGPPPGPPGWWPLAQAGLAVVGPAQVCRAVARALVGAALLDPAVALSLLHADPGPWRWARWLGARLGGEATARSGARVAHLGARALEVAGRHLVVVDGDGPWRSALERWWLGATPDRAAVVLGGSAPPWCGWVLEVTADGPARLTGMSAGPAVGTVVGTAPGTAPRTAAGTVAGTATTAVTGATARTVEAPVASAAWAEAHARRVAARDTDPVRAATRAGTVAPPTGLPPRVGPADVGLPADRAAVLAAWGGRRARAGRPAGLRVPLGLAAGGAEPAPAWVDLVADGPHTLVAGTTGSGKSELLQALVLGLALRHPPDELAVVLLDFKGGAGLRPCRALPHVVGAVSDLDRTAAVRALEAIGAELRRREALLDAAGAADVADLTAPGVQGRPPPRLLVVVDEFRALAEDLPDFVPALVRLAAQGRSLGMHLVLATQRPGGAVTAEMRANLALRICLRVTEPADSVDVLDVPDAAALPADLPGRALVRGADGVPRTVQTVWPALAPTPVPPAGPALPWPEFGTAGLAGRDPGAAARVGAVADGRAADPRYADALAGHAGAAARTEAGAGRPGPVVAPLWSPPLPGRVGEAELAAVRRGTAAADAAGLVLGLTDPPGAGDRGLLTWSGRGTLVVAGRARSGRTTTALRAAAAALAGGRHVHAVGLPPGSPRAHPCLGTVVGPDDPRRLARLLTVLADRGPGAPPALLVVDDVAETLAALDGLPHGAGDGLLDRLARAAARCALGVLVTGHPRDVQRLLPLATTRLVLPVADTADDAALGVPRDLSRRHAPGRAVLLGGAGATRCQVALPCSPGPGPAPVAPPTRVAPLPEIVRTSALAPPHRPGPTTVALGVGGDDAAAVLVDVGAGLLVAGPTGSGRSTTLATVAAGLARGGRGRPLLVTEGGPLERVAAAAGLPTAATGTAALALLRSSGLPAIVVVDDLDVLGRAAPELDDLLAAWVVAREAGDRSVPVVVAASRTDRAAAAYRGAVPRLRGMAPVVVLSPGEPGSAEVAGVDLAATTDPPRARHPGRGALVVRGVATPVQVALPDLARGLP